MPLTYRLQVDATHNLYIEERGNPQGVPILFLHGGPGTGISQTSSGYFDPSHYRIILFDQRGAGQSTPSACCTDNTTWHLVDDIEKIRLHLEIERWILFGGSWGSTLALAYAEEYPKHVLGMIVRGIFLCDEADMRWLLSDCAPHIWPKEWNELLSLVPLSERSDIMAAYQRLMISEDSDLRQKAYRAWALWEARNLTLMGNMKAFEDFFNDQKAEAITRIELHYFSHKAFLKPGQLLAGAGKLDGIPAKIIHGRYDTICPFSNAWKLHEAWPGSELIAVEGGGHAGLDPSIHRALVEATESFKSLSL